MSKYDYIIIGAGMGGLSTANFLAMHGKRVLVLEKHNKAGGLCTSFMKAGTSFDCGIESLYELDPSQTISQFFQFWGGHIDSVIHTESMCCYIDDDIYYFRNGHVKEDFLNQFPSNTDDIEKLFHINNGMLKEMFSGNGAPVPPYEMSLLEKLRFGLENLKNKPLFMKYGIKNFDATLSKITRNKQISTIIFSKAVSNMVYNGYAYRWGVADKGYYPLNGMQDIPDKAVELLKQRSGEVLCNTEVTEIILEHGQAIGVKTKNGDEYFADEIISNASPTYTYSLLPQDCKQRSSMQNKIKNRKIFQSCCILFMTVQDISSLNGNNFLYIADSNSFTANTESYTPESAPIGIQIGHKKPTDKYYPVVALVPIPYEYMNSWNTNGTKVRGEAYYQLKKQVKEILENRIYEKLGNEFKENVTYTELGTPLTFERYTNSDKGSFMGWAIDQKNYGRFMKQKTDVEKLNLVGQWTFPGFGIAGVMAGGYYLSKDLLKKDGINLERDFKDFFE